MNRINFITLAASLSFTMLACNTQPNDKLDIDGKKYTISLGEVNFEKSGYNAEDSLAVLTVKVLADGKPMPNTIQYTKTAINIDGQDVGGGTSSSQPVKMMLRIKGRGIFVEGSSEDGIFEFEAEEIPDIIEVYTKKKRVYFNARTKEIMSSKEYDLYSQEWITKNRAELGIE